MTHILIMAGGEGTRFQPLSTPERPKQFLNLVDPEKSLLQQTHERIANLARPQNIWVATNARHQHLVTEQIPKLSKSNLLLEARKKNTAPTVAALSWILAKRNPEVILIALPADNLVFESNLFCEDLAHAVKLAKKGPYIVTLGLKPTGPATKYGYIQRGTELITNGKEAFRVKQFVEKPDERKAVEYFESGGFYWNGGTFIFPAGLMLNELKKFQPKIYEALAVLECETGQLPQESLDDFFEACPSISIDYAVMEKTAHAAMIPCSFFWSDLGTWDTLHELHQAEKIRLTPHVEKIMLEQMRSQRRGVGRPGIEPGTP